MIRTCTMKSLSKFRFLGESSLSLTGFTCFKRCLGQTNVAVLTSLSNSIDKNSTGDSYLHSSGKWPLLGATIGQLIDRLPDRFGDRLAVIDCAQEIRKSFVEMKEDIDRLATGLLALNLKRGDRIAIWCPNRYEWITTQMATAKAGLILVTINPAYQSNEFAYCLGKVGLKAVIIQESFKIQKYYDIVRKVVPEVVDSKPVALSRYMGYFDRPTRICGQVPLFHCFGCVGLSNTSIVSGTCTVLPSPGVSAEASLKNIEIEKCNVVYGTPTMFVDMLNHPNFNKIDLSSLDSGMIGGASCPPELLKEIMEKMNCPGLVVVYGTTETSPLICMHDSARDDKITKLTTTGRPIENSETKIVNSNGGIVPRGTPGEICMRGFNVMKGYWDDEESTKKAIQNGWYHTGDIGTMTEDGYLTVVGRIKDMIIRGGENIYPKEIEDHLISHPKISDAYVIGIPDKRLGEELCAWIKLKTDEVLDENEVKDFCKGQLSHFKTPKYIRFVDSFPMTTSGKVQKYKMQEEMVRILKN